MTLLRIAYIINSLEGGGAALPVPDIVTEMRRNGADVRVFALSRRNGLAATAFDAAGIDYRTCPGGKSDHLQALRWLWSELFFFQPNLLWTSLTQATIIGQILGRHFSVPVVSWQHNAYLRLGNHLLLRSTRGLTRLWIADSSSVATLTAARFGIAASDILTWPLFKADAGAPEAMPCEEGKRLRIGSLGRLHPNKGYDILIAAMRIVKAKRPDLTDEYEIVIAGEGGERGRLEALAAKFGLGNVHFPGFAADPHRFLESCQGYVQPSRAEGFCIAAHEAMQAGLAAIVADVGEMAQTVVRGETGWIVPAKDAPALASALIDMIENRSRTYAMGQAARRLVLSRYSAQAFARAGQAATEQAHALIGSCPPSRSGLVVQQSAKS